MSAPRPRFLPICLGPALLGLAHPAQAQTTYNPAASFSGSGQPVSTDGVFRYGYETTLGGTFTLYDTPNPAGVGNVPGATGTLQGWDAAGLGDPPHLEANTSGAAWANAQNGSTITVQPGQLVLHPGPNGQVSVLRFTAPASGVYTFTATFNAADNHPATTDVHVLRNGLSVADGGININGGGNTATLSQSGLTLAKGDTLDFAVGYGGNGYAYDNTGLFAAVTAPEPSQNAALALGAAGMGLLALRARRGRRAA